MENRELKPCKCGSQAGVMSISLPKEDDDIYYPYLHYVQCDACDECTDYFQTRYEAIEAWNRRANDE